MKKKQLQIVTDSKVKYEDSGICSFCLLSTESLMPGGTETRHKQTKVKYGECPQAIRAKELRASK